METRLGVRLWSGHPATRWIVGYAAAVVSKYNVGSDGRTSYERLHCRRTYERLVEFGERVRSYIPKQ